MLGLVTGPFLLVCQEQHWGPEDTSDLRELVTQWSVMAVDRQPPTYIFFLEVVFKMSLFNSSNTILNHSQSKSCIYVA